MELMGNTRAREIYEANLSSTDSFRRPQSDSGLETFIRDKYERKKYCVDTKKKHFFDEGRVKERVKDLEVEVLLNNYNRGFINNVTNDVTIFSDIE